MLTVGGLPSLRDRSARDHVGGVYESMVREGSLIVQPGRRRPSLVQMVRDALARYGRPRVIICDYFRYPELADALDGARLRVEVVKRRMRYSEATEDIRRSQRLLLDEGRVVVPMSIAWDVQRRGGQARARRRQHAARYGCRGRPSPAGSYRLGERDGARIGRGRPPMARGHRQAPLRAAGGRVSRPGRLPWRAWERLRRKCFDRGGKYGPWRCERCGNGPPLECHHRDHDRTNNNPSSNLEALCAGSANGCHARGFTTV